MRDSAQSFSNMKTLRLFLLTSVLALVCRGQNFEGTLEWTFKSEITDPQMRQDLADAGSDMQDAMREMQEAMNDPEMQAMMAQNPMMRQMLQQQMGAMSGMMAGGNPMANMMPKGMTARVKGAKSLMVRDNGQASLASPSEILVVDAETAYAIDRANRRYQKLPAASPDAEEDAYTITRTDETGRTLNYRTRKYLVEPTGADADSGARFEVWTTTEIDGLNPRQLARMNPGRNADFIGQLDGIPVRMDIISPEMRMTMELTSLKEESIPDSVFQLPEGFRSQ